MDVTPYIAALREDLLSAAAAGDEHTQRAGAALAAALEPAARLALLHALSDMAAEVTAALDGERVVEVRLDGRDARVVVSQPHRSRPAEEPPPPPPGEPGDISRITLRLMEQLKNRAEQAANAQGMSLNAWIAQAVQGALHGASQRGWEDWGGGWSQGRARDDERRLRGWVQG